MSHSPGSSPAPDSPNQRQRELAAKVLVNTRGFKNSQRVHVCSKTECFPLSPLQCLRLLMHTFNREYSQVSSSASESKVSPSLGPLTPLIKPAVPLNFTAEYLSPSLQSLSALSSLLHLSSICTFIYLTIPQTSTYYLWLTTVRFYILCYGFDTPSSTDFFKSQALFSLPHPSSFLFFRLREPI